MRFYNRDKELAFLRKLKEKAQGTAQITFLSGPDRVGKTNLLMESYGNDIIYFYIEKKNEILLCEDFLEEVKSKFQIEVTEKINTFKDLFSYLMDLSFKKSFTLIIDEFHRLSNVNKSIYGEMKKIWDKKNGASRINLLLCGPEYALMQEVYDYFKKPVLGKVINRLFLKEFTTDAIKEILKDHYPAYTPEDLLAFYVFTGGVAEYVKILVEKQAFTLESILKQVFTKNSFFLEEGKNLLIDEFGKEYGNYFSILSLIATTKISRPEIESTLDMNVGGFLDHLEADLNILTKARPFFAKEGSRLIKYAIRDNFLNFWFRYIHKYMNEIKQGNLLYVRNIVDKDYAEYSHFFLKKYFVKKLEESQQYTHIGAYWENGNTNKIDIIVSNEFVKKITFVEVEQKKDDDSLSRLKEKSKIFHKKFPEYTADYLILGKEDM